MFDRYAKPLTSEEEQKLEVALYDLALAFNQTAKVLAPMLVPPPTPALPGEDQQAELATLIVEELLSYMGNELASPFRPTQDRVDFAASEQKQYMLVSIVMRKARAQVRAQIGTVTGTYVDKCQLENRPLDMDSYLGRIFRAFRDVAPLAVKAARKMYCA